MTLPRPPTFPDPSAAPDECAEVIARWEAVLAKAPRLRPWLEQAIERRRALLHESARGSIERALWAELERWVRDFERLPQFAVAAISTTLEEAEEKSDSRGAARRSPPPPPPAPPPPSGAEGGTSDDSPERAAADNEALLSDPAFALAFHCVEARVRPALPEAPPAWAWFGLLHASAAPEPVLTAQVAVMLVLRVLGAEWTRLEPRRRKAALRLFHATAGDLRAADRLRALVQELPWPIDPQAFVAHAQAARAALADACALCARIAASTRPTQRGGLSVLALDRSALATPEELAQLTETARKFSHMPGLQKLLNLTSGFFASPVER